MNHYQYIALRENPELMDTAAGWFNSKWGVPKEAYLECMEAYLKHETELGWFLCLDGEQIVGGLGVIENDFHDRPDLTPNVCAVYTEESHRCQGIAGKLLNMAVEDLRGKGISPAYLVTDHTSFYERYGWEFLCMFQGDGQPDMTRKYIYHLFLSAKAKSRPDLGRLLSYIADRIMRRTGSRSECKQERWRPG